LEFGVFVRDHCLALSCDGKFSRDGEL